MSTDQTRARQMAESLESGKGRLTRVELAAELRRLDASERELMEALAVATSLINSLTPGGICDDMHHRKQDQHAHNERCPVVDRFVRAAEAGCALIARTKEARNG